MNFDDLYEKEFREFEESDLYHRLDSKYQPVPYHRKFKLVRNISIAASYLFNGLSGVTASFLVYLFLFQVIGNTHIALFFTVGAIVLLELMKRKLSSLFFKDFLLYKAFRILPFLMLLLLSILSITSSFYGSQRLVVELTEAPESYSNDGEISGLNSQIEKLDKQIEDARNTTYSGVTTAPSQETIKTLSNQKESLLAEVLRVKKRTEKMNDQLFDDFQKRLMLSAYHFALITLLFELLFIATTYYKEYYDYRSYTEFHKPISSATFSETPIEEEKTVATAAIDPTILQAAIKNAKSNLNAYYSKMKSGQGTVEANQRGIERWQEKLRELEKLLPQNGTEQILESEG